MNWIMRKDITVLRVRMMFFFSRGGRVGIRVVRIGRWELVYVSYALNGLGSTVAALQLTRGAH